MTFKQTQNAIPAKFQFGCVGSLFLFGLQAKQHISHSCCYQREVRSKDVWIDTEILFFSILKINSYIKAFPW